MPFVVTKSPVGLEGTAEIIGVFDTAKLASQACRTPGKYVIANCTTNRAYRTGELLDCAMISIQHPGEIR